MTKRPFEKKSAGAYCQNFTVYKSELYNMDSELD